MSQAIQLQFLVSTAPSATAVLEAAEKAGATFLAEDEGDTRTILGLMPDGSLYLAIVQSDPEDDTRDQWRTASFPDISNFHAFLHDAVSEEIQQLLPCLSPRLREYLTRTVDKFTLSHGLEAGHA